MTTSSSDVKARLEYLREQVRAECISYGELSELQSLAPFIEPGDVELLQWAGVPEHGVELPLPGEKFEGRTIIASVWLNDDEPEPFALVLMLRDEPPFYELADITWREGGWKLSVMRTHPNIVPAVEDYQQSGGDY